MAAMTSVPLFLPVIFSDVENGTTLHRSFMVVLPSQGYSDVVRALSDVVGTRHDEITVFIERSNKERVRMMANSDLVRMKAVCLHVNVGLPRGACKVCDKALNYCLIREFHLCKEDKIISDGYFRSSVGPIQRPRSSMV
jgi:hypothetical protein